MEANMQDPVLTYECINNCFIDFSPIVASEKKYVEKETMLSRGQQLAFNTRRGVAVRLTIVRRV